MKKSEKWLSQQGGGEEVKNSLHYEEIGEMTVCTGGEGQEMKNSLHYEEIGEMACPITGRSGR